MLFLVVSQVIMRRRLSVRAIHLTITHLLAAAELVLKTPCNDTVV